MELYNIIDGAKPVRDSDANYSVGLSEKTTVMAKNSSTDLGKKRTTGEYCFKLDTTSTVTYGAPKVPTASIYCFMRVQVADGTKSSPTQVRQTIWMYESTGVLVYHRDSTSSSEWDVWKAEPDANMYRHFTQLTCDVEGVAYRIMVVTINRLKAKYTAATYAPHMYFYNVAMVDEGSGEYDVARVLLRSGSTVKLNAVAGGTQATCSFVSDSSYPIDESN